MKRPQRSNLSLKVAELLARGNPCVNDLVRGVAGATHGCWRGSLTVDDVPTVSRGRHLGLDGTCPMPSAQRLCCDAIMLRCLPCQRHCVCIPVASCPYEITSVANIAFPSSSPAEQAAGAMGTATRVGAEASIECTHHFSGIRPTAAASHAGRRTLHSFSSRMKHPMATGLPY